MIEKLEFEKYQSCTGKCRILKDKINEIIDHLPQEKEDNCESCINYCKGERDKEFCPNYLVKQPTKEAPDILNAIKEIMIQLYYEELHPISENPTAEECNNRKEKAIDEYLGKNQKPVFYPILYAKVNKAMAHIAKAIQEISALYRKEK